jgi:hypothetical protein
VVEMFACQVARGKFCETLKSAGELRQDIAEVIAVRDFEEAVGFVPSRYASSFSCYRNISIARVMLRSGLWLLMR